MVEIQPGNIKAKNQLRCPLMFQPDNIKPRIGHSIHSELRSCAKVEVAILGSPTLIVRTVSVYLTPSLPRCHLKTTNKSAKCETLYCFCLLFCTGMWKDLHQNTYIESRCHRSGKCAVCSRVHASFSPEILQAVAVKGLKQQWIWTASTFLLQPLWSGPSKNWSALSSFSVAKCLRVKPASPPWQSASSWPRSTAQRYTCLWMCLCLVGTASGGGGQIGHRFLGSTLLCEYSGIFLLINRTLCLFTSRWY